MSAEPNWAEIGILTVAFLSAVGGGLMRIASAEKTLNDRISEIDKELRSEISDSVSNESSIVGDAMQAIRQKTTDVEIWVRDNLVRRDEFTSSIGQINRGLDSLRSYVESSSKTTDEKIERMRVSLDGKLDKIIGTRQGKD